MRCALILMGLLWTASAAADPAATAPAARATPPAAQDPLTEVIGSGLAQRVEGCWDLREDYRVWLSRSGHGLRARQRSHRGGLLVTTTEVVRLDVKSGELGFHGIGRIHPVLVILRWGKTLEVAFSSKISPHGWSVGFYAPASRCAR